MNERAWTKFLTARDREVLAQAGYQQRIGFGARPVLLIVDMTYDFTGDRPEPILDSIKRWPNSSGESAWAAIAVTRKLLDAAKAKQIPVIYTLSSVRKDRWDLGGWRWKNARVGEWRAPSSNVDGNAIVQSIAPTPQDLVVGKLKASAFFATPLIGLLTQLQADSLIVVGGTTSGCVRASVVDAASYNLKVAVVEDGCFDRSEASHAINLCDMDAKYADIVGSGEALSYLDKLERGLFALPQG
ncbi:MAG: isochorismatase family protein [Casimicrobiaceae bacterium]